MWDSLVQEVENAARAIGAMVVSLTTLSLLLLLCYARIMAALKSMKEQHDKDVAKLKARDDFTDKRVDISVRSVLRRGYAASLRKGHIKEDEVPIAVDDRVRKAYEPIAPALRRLRRQYSDLPDERFIEVVEDKWGAWLNPHICIPLGVNEGECWAMALVVASESEPSDSGKMATIKGKA